MNWEWKGDFWAPDQYTTHEMPDLFKLGNFWYHIISEYSDNTQVIYRRGLTPTGPWELISDGALDGPVYFAGRTCADDEGNRYLVGWIAGRNTRDDRAPWGGVSGLWVHRIIRREDGSLGEALPDPVYCAFAGRRPLQKEAAAVETSYGRKETVPVPVTGGPGTDPFLLESVIEAGKGTCAFSLNLLEGKNGTSQLRFGFYDSSNGTRMTGDAKGGQFTNYTGYTMYLMTTNTAGPLALHARKGGSSTLGNTSTAHEQIGTNQGTVTGNKANDYVNGTSYTANFIISRTGINELSISMSVTGGAFTGVAGLWTTTADYTKFDTFAVIFGNGTIFSGFTLADMTITYNATTIPEPSLFAALPGAVALLLALAAGRFCRRRIS
jgi:hypothetical protein